LGPPDDYDFRADVMPETRRVVAEQYPDLLDVVDRGVLLAWRRGEHASAAAAAALRGEVAPPPDAAPEPELVLVLGVAHASRRSAADVDRVIRSVRPDNVVVELCRSRASLLRTRVGASEEGGGEGGSGNSATKTQNPVPLGGASSFAEAFARSLRLGGQAGLVLQLALGWRARAATNPTLALADADGVVGAEFGAAATAADAVGAQLVLGDRPIEVTLARAWAACGGLKEKAALLRDLLLLPMPEELSSGAGQGDEERGGGSSSSSGGGDDSRRAVVTVSSSAAARFAAAASPSTSVIDAAERLRSDDDAVSAALRLLTRERPALASPLVHERDAYLAWSLRRSKAVRGSAVVVGVVGAAHMRGVAFCLRHGARYHRQRRVSGEQQGEERGAEGEDADDETAPLSFADLARTGPKRTGGERVMRAVMDVAIGVAAWAAWEALF
jgi:pheromone shutdown protein TraB